jgi:hypothetical protein
VLNESLFIIIVVLIESDFPNRRQIVSEMIFISCSSNQKFASILLSEKISEENFTMFFRNSKPARMIRENAIEAKL